MRSLPLRAPHSVLFFLGLIATAVASSNSQMKELGDNTYVITRTANSAFDRDVEKFKRQAQEDAEKFCATQNKKMKVISLTSDRPFMSTGYTFARLEFKALDATDPALTAPEPVAEFKPLTTVTSGLPAGPSGDLYTEILKLDDLRKRGLLTDKEFEQEKKKLLKRSK